MAMVEVAMVVAEVKATAEAAMAMVEQARAEVSVMVVVVMDAARAKDAHHSQCSPSQDHNESIPSLPLRRRSRRHASNYTCLGMCRRLEGPVEAAAWPEERPAA